ncbi:VirK/YbjX family protein [Edwardsiella tarda]|uniref:VirK/YbjX family protein n=1 Tax=Edwardsiella tarda TaxID=636 RepID=UPI000D50EA77|nr:VirK/YbjX family protein [Edwardsiella tarda]UCQ55349.1 VirK/YbjX family protein [Edwardsiella tarda]
MSTLEIGHARRPAHPGFTLFAALAQGKYRPSGLWHKASFRAKFALRTLLMPRASGQLLTMLASLAQRDAILSCQPRLPCRLHHPYLSRRFSRHQIIAALNAHYRLIDHWLSHAQRQALYGGQSLPLAQVCGKQEQSYTLRLAVRERLGKEGELSLSLHDQQDHLLAVCTFTLLTHHGVPTLFIGGLQGSSPSLPHSYTQAATKACHGLFPKRLLAEALSEIAQRARCQQILAVGNADHIYSHWRYRRKKQSQMLADYDGFWRSLNGKPNEEGYFSLPLTPTRKPAESIPSKKRAEYRRRYQLLDALQQALRDHLDQAPSSD